jgi:tetratricopeptide (TPR) repeat protein/ferredoxin
LSEQSTKTACSQPRDTAALGPSFLSPESSPRGPVRPSRMGKRRAAVLILIHLVVLAHLVHWRMKGATVSPLEPSESMYTLKDGILNAGAILLVLSILSTLVLGRFFCGWGCHVVALQDFCAWLLKKIGIHPRPLRSRWLMFVPLFAGLYMFFWPSLMGLVNGIPPPHLKNGLTKVDFWETFPGFLIGALTFLTCGFAIVYLLGAKGFCTYACPYGGLFGVVDRFAAGRIRVTDACKQCGHCTAVCTSNVIVNREVLEYGMVVDPGCMKCQDCVSVCPEGALYFGFGKPAFLAKARRKLKDVVTPQFSWREELALLTIFGVTLAIFRGLPQVQVGESVWFQWAEALYGQVPLLFALGLSAITAFVLLFAFRTLRRPAVDFLGLSMKSAGRISRAGKVFLAVTSAWVLFLGHSAAVQYHMLQGLRLLERDEATKSAVWWQKQESLAKISPETRERWREGEEHLVLADRLGLVQDPRIPRERSWAALAGGRIPDAIALLSESVRRNPEAVNSLRDLAHMNMLRGDAAPAIESLREAIRLRPREVQSHMMLVAAFVQAQDLPAAIAEQRVVIGQDRSPQARVYLAQLLSGTGDLDGVIAELRALVSDHPDLAPAQAMLGLALTDAGIMDEARQHFERAEKLSPGIVESLAHPDSRAFEPR